MPPLKPRCGETWLNFKPPTTSPTTADTTEVAAEYLEVVAVRSL